MLDQLLRDALRDIKDDQKRLAMDFTDLRTYISNHMDEEGRNLQDLRVALARLEEQMKTNKTSWSKVWIVLTSGITSLVTIAISKVYG